MVYAIVGTATTNNTEDSQHEDPDPPEAPRRDKRQARCYFMFIKSCPRSRKIVIGLTAKKFSILALLILKNLLHIREGKRKRKKLKTRVVPDIWPFMISGI